MASLESLQTRALAARTLSGRTVDDGSLALEITHVSTNATPSVTMSVGTGITLADVGYTTGSLAFNVYTTLGALVDVINQSHFLYWNARIIDGLRATSTASSSLIPNGVISSTTTTGAETIYRVFLDHSVAKSAFYRVALDRGILYTDDGQKKSESDGKLFLGHRVKITGIKYNENVNAAQLNGVRIYEWDPFLATETEIWSAKSVDATDTSIDFTLNPVTAREGNELIVMVEDDTSLTDDAANYLQVDYIRE